MCHRPALYIVDVGIIQTKYKNFTVEKDALVDFMSTFLKHTRSKAVMFKLLQIIRGTFKASLLIVKCAVFGH